MQATTTTPKPAKKTKKSVFDSLKRLRKDIRNMKLMRKRETMVDAVWNQLIALFDENKWNYTRNDRKKHLLLSFNVADGHVHMFRFDFEGPFLRMYTLVLDQFEESQSTDVMILASHFNTWMRYGKMSANISQGLVEIRHELMLAEVILNPHCIRFFMDQQANLFMDSHEAFSKMLETGEDPVFIIAEILENRKSRSKKDG
jgi:hypothetical protein